MPIAVEHVLPFLFLMRVVGYSPRVTPPCPAALLSLVRIYLLQRCTAMSTISLNRLNHWEHERKKHPPGFTPAGGARKWEGERRVRSPACRPSGAGPWGAFA